MKKNDYSKLTLLKDILSAVCLCLLSGGVLLFYKEVSSGVGVGIAVCVETVIPSLFTFMILSTFLASSNAARILSFFLAPITKYVLHLDKSLGCTVLVSMVGGYPVGAKAISDLYRAGSISPRQASLMLCFCCNAAPAFLIGGVGAGMLGNAKAGLVIYVCCILSSLVIGYFLGFGNKEGLQAVSMPPRKSFAQNFVLSVSNCTSAIVVMCGFILLFSALIALLGRSGLIPAFGGMFGLSDTVVHILSAIVFGFLEVTTGCLACSSLGVSGQAILIPFFASFSGLSVIFQVMAMFQADHNISFKPFVLSRIAHGILTVGMSYPFLMKLLQTRAVSGFCGAPLPMVADTNTPLMTLCMLGMCCMVFLVMSRNSLQNCTIPHSKRIARHLLQK